MDDSRSRLRLIDASLNRAAEGLRVAEDVCRFHWNLPGLALELKNLRHDLLIAGRGDWARHQELLEARDVEGDVGRASGVATRAGRPATETNTDALPVAAFSNLERTREALRSLEEVNRQRDSKLAGQYESIRYRLYSLEKSLANLREGDSLSTRLDEAKFCLLLTQSLCGSPLMEAAGEAVRAGVDMVQLREKSLSDRELLSSARSVREWTARLGVLFIVNDRPDIARLSHADGVHIGQDDLTVGDARLVAGEQKLIGVSAHSTAEALRAVDAGADYLGVGPMFPTRTKVTGPAIGAEGLHDILARVDLPAFAIGGITERNLPELLASGSSRIAVSSGVLSSPDITGTVRGMRGLLDGE